MIEEIIKVSYLGLKKVKSGNFKSVIDELDMLGIKYSEDDLMAAYQISQESESIEGAIKLIKSGSEDFIKKAKNFLVVEKEKEQILIKEKEETKRAKKEREKDIQEQAQAFNYLKNITSYKICGAKSMYDLESEVQKAIQSGYVPYGGLSIYNPGGKIGGVPDSFFQAMVRFK
jgi:hypothetical protein